MSTGATKANWRKWAIQKILFEHGPLRTKDLLDRIESEGWDVLPKNGRLDSIHATCNREAKLGIDSKIARIDGRPVFWALTPLGRDMTSDFLINNHHITPEKSREEGAYRRR